MFWANAYRCKMWNVFLKVREGAHWAKRNILVWLSNIFEGLFLNIFKHPGLPYTEIG
jgi:hypothetical protein